MKKIVILLVALSLQSCIFPFDRGDDVDPGSYYKAVYMDRDAFEASVSIDKPGSIDNAGKIYVDKNYLFINDIYSKLFWENQIINSKY